MVVLLVLKMRFPVYSIKMLDHFKRCHYIINVIVNKIKRIFLRISKKAFDCGTEGRGGVDGEGERCFNTKRTCDVYH